MTVSRITTNIDFEKSGRQTGFLRLPHSVHESAYGWIPIPLVCLKNGTGPTVLLCSGNHGDEYEGQVALMKLIRELKQEDLQGRIIFLPLANFPAGIAGRRTSPIDSGNLNRSFPGNPDGTPTQMIAHYIDSVILPLCDYAMDLHSGGSSLMYLPSALVSLLPGKTERNAKTLELLKIFGAPISYVSTEKLMGSDQTLGASAERHGVLKLGTELGGGGTVTPAALKVAENGVRRVLKHLGVLPDIKVESLAHTRILEVGDADYFVYSSESGVFEPLVELGDAVKKDQPAAAIHFSHTPWREPEILRFERDGMVLCKRVPGRTERGDCLFHLGTDFESRPD
ncbi:succinylglutamate desuccinylase/aspartoacylase family protein [Bradyrhizobium zhanjiangense]|uniref:Deacylase n=1 Tax=Bradyrhizobium zhanjiangense TaxID=1325107 RepID=A0A4Q0Q5S1_9BRAD|nr:succinylglutamate desuccinylase/aspartoacylase family protein [Bradyrhizobium zhanjiangense]RXG83576.1 deacylase [Bradyrhizobium zhanjiangense]